MSKSKIFITGIAGFLGSHLANRFIEEGYQVAGCDNLLGGYIDNVPPNPLSYESACSGFEKMQKTKNFTAKYYSRILESQNVYNFKKIYDTLISKEIIIKNKNFEIAKFDKVKFETVYQLNNDPNLFKC